MKTFITIQENDDHKLVIHYQTRGERFTPREKRLVNLIAKQFPKNAIVETDEYIPTTAQVHRVEIGDSILTPKGDFYVFCSHMPDNKEEFIKQQ